MPNGNFGFKGEIEDLRLGETLVENQEKKIINLFVSSGKMKQIPILK